MDIVYNHKTYTVYEAHRYTIKELSKDLISLAQSSHGHEIIRHKEKPQRGFQFHPEANMDTTDGKELLSLVTGMDF
ncbi:MAG: hypothetical protein H6766_05815 [Candidatus Peribacteria bacterium]|nr:MAG: hypothetical protein H6766_05815 [Candidatus Peribacteria bacterium]